MTNDSSRRLTKWNSVVAFGMLVVRASGLAAQTQPTTEAERAAREAFFESKVRPVLVKSCVKCHGAEKQEGGLRLDSIDAMLKGGDSGPAVIPHAVADSLIVSAVRYEGIDMPPSGQLPEEEQTAIAEWVEQGAVWPEHNGVTLELRSKSGITDEDKRYWAFQPLRRPSLPTVLNQNEAAPIRTAIDAFVQEQLDASELQFAPPADSRTLMRRVYFDLIGVPPTVGEAQEYLAEADQPGAYERLVERLLDDPRYGEKWARHWLDLVRYAESDGFNQDAYRPNAYLYRDWLIRSLNEDKPYDQMVLEQIAGDELDETNPDYLAATGYLRHWIYEYNQRDVRTQWSNILNDLTDVTGEVFFGLGVGCARCHDHKFDPLLQRDYYRLQASFATFMPRDDRLYGTQEELAKYRERLAEWESATERIRAEIAAIEDPIRKSIEQKAIDKFPIDVRPLLRRDPAHRDGYEDQIAHLAHLQTLEEWNKLDFSKTLKGDQKTKWEALQAELKAHDKLKPKKPMAVMSAGNIDRAPPPTKIPAKEVDDTTVAPASFEVFGAASLASWEGEDKPIGRRTALAHWINSPDNPLPHRVIVNRVWQYHFGTGLVENASDFGRLGVPPTHPELLDWLATWFIENGRSFKKLHRLIVTSTVYRQAAQNPECAERGNQVDLANKKLWHYPGRRLEAEMIRDAMLVAAGNVDWTTGGPSAEHESLRRSIYTKIKRNKPNAMLVTFDAPDGNATIAKRNVTTTPIQSLLLSNFGWPLDVAKAMADEIVAQNDALPDQVKQVYLRALQREPTEAELNRAVGFIEQAVSNAKATEQSEEQQAAQRDALVDTLGDLCHVLFNTSEFLYID